MCAGARANSAEQPSSCSGSDFTGRTYSQTRFSTVSPPIFPIALGFVRELLLEPSLFATSPSLHVPANPARGGENLLNPCYSSRLKMLIRFFFPGQPGGWHSSSSPISQLLAANKREKSESFCSLKSNTSPDRTCGLSVMVERNLSALSIRTD